MPLPSIPEYSTSIKMPALIYPKILNGGHPIEKGVRLVKYSGGFCVVFPYETSTNKYAVRCWHAEISDAKKRTQLIAEALKESNLPYFVRFDYFEKGIRTQQGIQPLVVMDWVEAQSLKRFISANLYNLAAIETVTENFKAMVADLHEQHFSHGDLQHGNIMVKDDYSLVLVDYDSMYVPALQGMSDEIKGIVGYQHEARWNNKYVSEKADYFSELVIYLSLKAFGKHPDWWETFKVEDTETLLFTKEDIKSKGCSQIFDILHSDPELAPMSETLIEFMHQTAIEDLQPLEDALMSTPSRIASKWVNGNGYIPVKNDNSVESLQSIVRKWQGGNGYQKTEVMQKQNDELINSIFKKIKPSI